MKSPITERLEREFYDLLQADDEPTISVQAFAKYLKIDPMCMHKTVISGGFGPGFGYKGDKHSRGYARISKLALKNWMEQGGLR